MSKSDPEQPQQSGATKLQLPAPFVIAGVCGGLGIWLLYARPSFWGFTLAGLPLAALLVGLVGAILIFTLPVCLLILFGARPVMTLSPLFPSQQKRARWAEMRQRPMLSDDEFYERFYADTGIAREIPIRLRRIYATQLAMDRVWPSDKATEFDGELDLADLVADVAEEFNVEVSNDEALKLDGSFDSIVRLVAGKIASGPPEPKLHGESRKRRS